jgi:hypothetical protein
MSIDSWQGQGFSRLHRVQMALGSTQPAIQWELGALAEGKAAGACIFLFMVYLTTLSVSQSRQCVVDC